MINLLKSSCYFTYRQV